MQSTHSMKKLKVILQKFNKKMSYFHKNSITNQIRLIALLVNYKIWEKQFNDLKADKSHISKVLKKCMNNSLMWQIH